MDRMDGWNRAPERVRTGADDPRGDGGPAAGDGVADGCVANGCVQGDGRTDGGPGGGAAPEDDVDPGAGGDPRFSRGTALADAEVPDGVPPVSSEPRCRRVETSRRDADDARRRDVHGRIAAGYERISRGLRIIAFEILRDEHEAEDAAHDAFARVLEHAGNVRDPQATEAWPRRTVRNLAVNRLRRRRRCRADARASDETLDDDPAQGPRVVRRSGSSEIEPAAAVAADAAFAALGTDLREAASLYYLSGLSCAEVGRAQGVAEGCARTRVHRARRRLLRGLFGSGDEA